MTWHSISMPAELARASALFVVDLEATCCDAGTLPHEEMEIIEIGAVRLSPQSLAVEDTFQTFVAPVRHPVLTSFCTELTGISGDMLEGAPGFSEAIGAFAAWIGAAPERAVLGSWGAYDRNQIRQDANYHHTMPALPPHANLKQMFSRARGTTRRFGMAGALRACGLSLEGRHHRALDDALNIARLVPFIVGDEASTS